MYSESEGCKPRLSCESSVTYSNAYVYITPCILYFSCLVTSIAKCSVIDGWLLRKGWHWLCPSCLVSVSWFCIRNSNQSRQQKVRKILDFTQWLRSNLTPNIGINYFRHSHVEPVALRLSSTSHYQLDGSNTSLAEFSALLPDGGHTVHIDNNHGRPEVYTVTLLHQMKCVDIIQAYYVNTERPSKQPLSTLARHCLNYLKQTTLCRPSLGLESIQTPEGHAVRSYEAVCNDWSAVYAETERNQNVWRKELGLTS